MRLKEIIKFDSMTIYRLGWSPAGKPLMTVCLYVLDDLMIDTGQPLMKKEVLDIASAHRISKVMVTHHHEDHAGNAGDIHKLTGARILAGSLTAAKIKNSIRIMPYQYLVWGRSSPCEAEIFPDVIEHGDYKLEPIFTPGHAKDHNIFYEKNRGWLFSGDLYIGSRIRFFRSDENLVDQIESIKKACMLDFDVLLCGHNPVFDSGKEALKKKLSFLEDLYGRCHDIWLKGTPINKAVRELSLKEATVVRLLSCGNASLENIIYSAYKSFEKNHLPQI